MSADDGLAIICTRPPPNGNDRCFNVSSVEKHTGFVRNISPVRHTHTVRIPPFCPDVKVLTSLPSAFVKMIPSFSLTLSSYTVEGTSGWRSERHHWALRTRYICQGTEYARPATTWWCSELKQADGVRWPRLRARPAGRCSVGC